MNERINTLFQERYWKVASVCNTFHLVMVAASASIVGFGFVFFVLPESHIAIPLSITLFGAIGYLLMFMILFKHMSYEGIRKRIIEATEETEGTVIAEMQGPGIHQVTFTYTVQGKKFKQGDHFSVGQNPRVGEKVKVRYIPKKPKHSYIAEKWSEPVATGQRR